MNDVSDLKARLFGGSPWHQHGDIGMRIGQHPDVADFKPGLRRGRRPDGELLPIAQNSEFDLPARPRAHSNEKLLPRIDVAAGNRQDAIAALNARAFRWGIWCHLSDN